MLSLIGKIAAEARLFPSGKRQRAYFASGHGGSRYRD
jgi:hypothetical protein